MVATQNTPTPATNAANTNGSRVTDVAPDLLASWLEAGDTALIDVREDFEHAEERIAGATLVPLSKFDADEVRRLAGDKRVVFHCRSGKRSVDAATRFAAPGDAVMHLAGGIEAWKASGMPVIRPAKQGLPVMRQVQIVAGGLVALGVALGVTVSPWLLVVPGFVGCGLVFAGVTGWCGMAKLLAVMPWNRAKCRGVTGSSCAA